MKNAKKWLCLLLAVSLVTVFAACGSPAAKPAAEASEKTPAEPAAETPADAAEEKDAQPSRKPRAIMKMPASMSASSSHPKTARR